MKKKDAKKENRKYHEIHKMTKYKTGYLNEIVYFDVCFKTKKQKSVAKEKNKNNL